jgi:3-oxoadipate enol-lactonase
MPTLDELEAGVSVHPSNPMSASAPSLVSGPTGAVDRRRRRPASSPTSGFDDEGDLMERHELVGSDVTTRYWTGGDDLDPTLVFLHGATLDHRSWGAQVEALRARYRVVVPDLRGHGESRGPGPFTFASAVNDVVALFDELDLERVGLVGLSLGGNIAQEIVYRDPGRVAALVIADSTCNTAARHALQAPMSIAALSGLGLMAREAFLQATANVTDQDAEVQRYVRDVNRTRSTRDSLQILTSMLSGALHPDEGYRLPVPTLLMHGDGDQLGDIVAGTRDWAKREPRAEYVSIPRARHASNQDNPQVFNAALISFLDRVLTPNYTPSLDGATGTGR